MCKVLKEMSLEQLWQLFPIQLTKHQFCWADWFAEEKQLLLQLFSDSHVVRISHIGSTAVETIWAKPIVDILAEFSGGCDLKMCAEIAEQAGYLRMSESDQRISLNKGYTPEGFSRKVFHLHLRYAGDNDELYFRDFLREHLTEAKAYETLKLELWKQYEHNRDAYTDSKTAFVRKYTEIARLIYGNRYQ